MTPQEAIEEIRRFKRLVVREMPHDDCKPYVLSDGFTVQCNCYKLGLHAALIRAEVSLLGKHPEVEPF